MLTASGLNKSFGSKKVLENINLSIRPGEITCVIGPSGTGKTTLLRAMALLEHPDSGTIGIDDVSYTFPLPPGTEIAPPWPRLTVVFQSLFLWPHMTLRDNILLPALTHNPDRAHRDLEGLIKVFEMERFIDNYPNEASIGQRQRVALARALILNPRYILLDEITSALDVEQTARILNKLSHLRERDIGVMLITHQIGFARRTADQVIFMSDGTVTESGPASIIDRPQTERMQKFLSMIEGIV